MHNIIGKTTILNNVDINVADAAPLTPKSNVKINNGPNMIFNIFDNPKIYRGVLVYSNACRIVLNIDEINTTKYTCY